MNLCMHLVESGLHGQIRKKLNEGPDPATTMTLWKLCLAPFPAVKFNAHHLQNFINSFTHNIFSLPNLNERARASDVTLILPYVIDSLSQETELERDAMQRDDDIYVLQNVLAFVKLHPSKNTLLSVSYCH